MDIKLNEIPNIVLSSEENEFTIDEATALKLVEILNENQYNSILDLGSGVTTRIFSYYKENVNPDCNITTVENNRDYLEDIIDLTNVNKLIFPVHLSPYESFYIGLNRHVKKLELHFDFVCVDGPCDYKSELPRKNIINLIQLGAVDKNTAIMIHDTDRLGEQKLLQKIKELLPEQKEIKLDKAVFLLPNN